ncbi:MAG: dephospho-CoA kinase [Candidatus Marinimicrobia bacterium]|jgi:dephospho-CoA kinase|nr:dephospho-CoA kinase [Candidatus Neomarinimicrobiota bacterium]|tara:strand:- start:440 stop:1033 length:594 start_codon:yes stop_codon:yes gene_type:complete
MLKVGVTGGIGSGKSAASIRMEELGAYRFDADKEAKEILSRNEQVQKDLIEEFSTDILNPDGTVNSQKLARVAFANDENQAVLNAIIHPHVFESIDRQYGNVLEKGVASLFVVDAALIYESGLDQHLDYVIVVSVQYGQRMQRALKRGKLKRGQIQKRMDLQLPEEAKSKMADFIIDNNGSEEDLIKQVGDIYSRIT